MAEPESVADAMVAAALRLAAADGWQRLSLREVAASAGVSLRDAYDAVPSKAALLAAIIGSIDRRVLAAGVAGDGDTPRDRLFEIVMRRFDALQEHRDGFLAILKDAPLDPFVAAPVLPVFARSMGWMLEAAAIPTDGPIGNLRVKAFSALYLNTLRTWRRDDSLDLARTMAVLDRGLRQMEGLVERCPRLAGRGRGSRSTMPPPPAPDSGDGDSGAVEGSPQPGSEPLPQS